MYTYATDAIRVYSSYDTALAAIAAAVADGEWNAVGSTGEARDIANGAWLCVYGDGIPVLVRGVMP